MADKQEFTLPSGIGISAYKSYLSSSTNSSSVDTGVLITPGGAGVGKSLSVGGTLQLFNGSNFTALKSAAVSNAIYTLPSNYPSTGTSVLQSDSAGLMSWVPMVATSAGGGASGFATTASYAYQSGYGLTSGFATTANYSYQSGYGITSGFATTASYAYQSGYAITSGIATTANYSYQSGYAITSGFATTAANINVVNATSNSTHPIVFTSTATGSGVALSTNTTLSYNPSTNILSTSGLAITATTASTSTSTGALTVAGGVGIAGSSYFGNDVTVGNSQTGRLNFSQGTLGSAGTTTNPSLMFVGQDNNPITLSVLSDNTLSFEGSSGQLFSINNNLSSGTIFSVNDISGIPIIRANANGTLSMGEFTGSVGVGLTNPSYKLHIAGDTNLSSGYVFRINGNSVLSASTLGTGVTNSSLTSVGIISSGTWSGSTITGFYGGTGYTNYSKGDILVGAGNTFIKLNVGTDNFVLTASSSSATGLTWSPTAATGITTLNSLTSTQQFFAIGTSGSGFNISSSGSTHTFNIPIAGSGSTGLVTTLAQTIAGAKTFTSAIIGDLTGTATTANYALQSGYAITSGLATTSNYAYQSGYAITSGLASTANLALTISSTSTSANADYNIPFFSGTALSTNSNLYYNPSAGRFNALLYTGSWAGNTITSFYGGTGYSTYSTGDLLVGAGSTLSKLAVGNNNFILVADNTVAGGIRWANISGFAITNINGLTTSKQDLAFGYSGSVPAFSSSGSTHTLNIPLAGTGSTGLVSTQTQSFAGNKTFTNAVSVTDSTGSGSYTTGALIVSGGVGIGGTLNVQGDLNVQGTFTTINSTTITVADKNIELGVVATPTDLTAQGGGITLRGATDKSISWYSGVGWSSSESFNLANGNTFKISGTSVLSTTSLGTGVTNSSLTALGTITTGVWAGTLITTRYGGTGYNSYTKGDILVGVGNTLAKLPAGNDLTILAADSSSGTGLTWKGLLSPTYGAFGSTSIQTVLGANTETLVNYNLTYEANNVTIGSGTTTRVYINDSGVFNVQFSAQISLASGTQPKSIDMWFKVSGVAVPRSNTRQTITGKDQDTVLALNYVSTFVSGQYIELAYSSPDANIQLGSYTGLVSPTRPDIPSMILSVTPVSSILPGSGLAITGLASLNLLTANAQTMVPGTSGVDFNISSIGSVHTFNIPDASTTARGLITTGPQTLLGSKTFASGVAITSISGSASTSTGALVVSGGVGIGQTLFTSPSYASSISGVVLSNGVITSGTWAGSTITAFYGGTGYNSYTKGDILVGAGNTFIKLNVGTDNYVLTASSTSATGLTWSPTSATGITTLNSLTANQQFFATGTSGSGFNISSSGSTHTFNIPIAGTGATGLVSTLAQSFAGVKTFTNDVIISSSTASTFIGNGALQVYGGVGISGRLSFNQAAMGFTGILTNPSLAFIGTTGSPITLSVLADNSLSFEGSSGQLFSIDNNLTTGEIFAVSDISGLPIISAYANQNVTIGEFGGNLGIGLSNPFYKLHVTGSVGFTSSAASTSTSTGALVVTGGVGIGGSLNVNSASSISSVRIDSGTVYGNLTGTATTATYAIQSGYAVTSGSSSTATTATYAYQSGYGLTSGFATTGNYAYQSGYAITSGLATTASYSYQSGYATTSGSSGLATTATYAHQSGYAITSGNSNTSGYATTSGLATTANYSYQSGYGITSGLATTATYAYQSGYAITSGLATTATYAYQSGYGITSGFATTASYSYQSGYATTSGIANSSYSSFVNTATANSSHPILFSPITGNSSGAGLSLNTILNYNPSSNILYTSGLAITATTASSSTSNGALTVAGGVGISGRLSFNLASFGTTGISSNPTIAMIGSTGDPIYLSVLEDNTISFEGSQGQLFSITPNLSTGYIYSVNDITGIPLLRANANANVTANEYAGNFGIGLSNPGYKLHVIGSVGFTSNISSTSTSSGTLVVSGGVGIGGSLNVNSASNISSVILNSGNIYGNLIGTATTAGFATTANYSHQSGYATTAGLATTATYSYQSGYGLTSGFASTATYSYQSGYGLTSGLATTATYSYQSGYGITAGLATTATYSHQAGYAITSGSSSSANSASIATTASNINVNTGTNNIYNPVLFTPQGTGSGVAVSSSATLGFNPTANTLSVSGLAVTASTGSTSTSTGALTVTGGLGVVGDVFVASSPNSRLSIMQSAGDEGGEIFLNKPVTNTTLNTGLTIDIYQNRLRFFEAGGSNRGFYLDIATGGNSVGTNIMGSSSSGTVNSGTATYAAYYPSSSNAVSENANLQFTGTGISIGGNIASTSTTSGSLRVFGGVGIGGSFYVAGAVNVGTNTFAKNYSGDLNFDNGTADTPGVRYYWQNNRNFGTDVYYSGSGSTRWRVVKEMGETGGAELFSIDREGAIYINNPGSGVVSLKHTGSGSATYTFPNTAPATGTSVLQSDTSGVLSWVAPTSTYANQSGYATTSGLATTATYSYQSGYGLTSGFATTANYAYQSGYAITSGSSGAATTATYAHQSGYAITSGSSGTATTATYAYQSGYGLTSGFATTASYSYQAGYAITSGSSGTATSAANINVVLAATNASHQVLFTPTAGSASGVAVSTENSFVYNPSTDILSVSGLAVTSGLASTNSSTGALIVTGGVGISGNLNIGGRVGIGTNVLNGAVNLVPPSTSASAIVIQGNASQSADVFATYSSSGSTNFSINNGGRARLTGLDGIWNTKVNQNIFDVSDGRVNWNLSTWQYSNIYWTTAQAGFSQASLQLQLTHAGTSTKTGIVVVSNNWDANNRAFGIVDPAGTERTYFGSIGNLSIDFGNRHTFDITTWNATNQIQTNISGTAGTYVGYIFRGRVESVDRFTVGPYGNTTVSLGGTTVSTGLIVKAAASQTGNLIETQSSTGATNFYVSSTGAVSIGSSTTTTNATTGALIVTGGVGIGQTLFTSSSYASSISGVILNNGSVSLSGTYTQSNSSTTALSVKDGSNNTKFNVDTIGGIVSVSSSIASTNTSTGALIVSGGVGIGGSLYVSSATAISGVTINAGVITGSLSGTATTATYAHQSGYATTSGFATTATYSYQSGYGITAGLATTATYAYQSGYAITSGNSNTSGYATTSGLATTATYSYQSGYGLTSGFASTASYAYQSGYATTSGLATTATYAYQSGYAITSGLATSSTSVFINNATANSNHPLVFTPISGSSSGAALSTNSTVSYNPSTNYLYTSGLAVTASTASTSTSTGALIVNGGVGISGQLSYNTALIGTTGESSTPTMTFIGANGDPVKLRVLDDSTLAFSGSQGQLFSINPVLNTGYIFSVNDISGVPLIRANADATVSMGEFAGNIGIGLSNPAYKLHVTGSVGFTSSASSTSSTTGALVVSGGVGIGGSLYVASATAISGVTINNGIITGNLTGTATTSTYSYQSGYGLTSGFATTATYSYTSGYGITAGLATTATYSHQSGYAITSGSSGFATTATYSYTSGYGLTSGFATTATYSYQSGYAITSGNSNTSGYATTSGLATTATYSYQSGYGLTSGLATTATYALQSGYAITSGSSNTSGYATTSGFATTSTYSYQSGYGLTSGFADTSTYSYQSGYGITAGLATTSTYSYQSGYGLTSGLATTATYSYQSGYAITSGSSATANTATYSYQSGYGLTSGLATTATYAHQSGYAITSGSSNTSGYATTSGLATTATYAYQSGFAITATSASTATTATNSTYSILTADTTNATRRLVFTANGTGSTSLYNTNTVFTNPSSSSIGASVFTGLGSINIRPGFDATSGVSIGNSSGTSYVYFDTINGRIGINQPTPLYDLHIVGELSATSKSFVIDHPTKPNMTLRYGSLEGPENGVYVRGKLINSKTISLPDYWSGLVDEDSITVSLTPIDRFSKLYVEKIEDYVVHIQDAESNPIKCYFVVYGERKDVPKLDVEY